MDITSIIDLFLHLDKHLEVITATWGIWIYAFLFAIIFIETGLVAMPFFTGRLFIVCSRSDSRSGHHEPAHANGDINHCCHRR